MCNQGSNFFDSAAFGHTLGAIMDGMLHAASFQLPSGPDGSAELRIEMIQGRWLLTVELDGIGVWRSFLQGIPSVFRWCNALALLWDRIGESALASEGAARRYFPTLPKVDNQAPSFLDFPSDRN